MLDLNAFIIIMTLVIIVSIIIRISTSFQDKEQKAKDLEIARKQILEKQKLQQQQKTERELLYGPLTKEIGYLTLDHTIQIYDEKNVIFINEKPIQYNKILSFRLVDNSEQIISEGIQKSKTSTGSMIGRGVAGALIGGGIGALAGAATAKKNIEVEPQQITTKHNYLIYVDIANVAAPLITINCKNNEFVVQKIVATLSYIVNKNSEIKN